MQKPNLMLLASGASLISIAIGLTSPAAAASIEKSLQIAAEAGDVIDNSETIGLTSEVFAAGDSAIAVIPFFTGIDQVVFGTDSATASITNNGLIAISLDAQANGETYAQGGAVLNAGIRQLAVTSDAAFGEASAELDNAGTVEIAVNGYASAPAGTASAFAVIGRGVTQVAAGAGSQGGEAVAAIDNSGTFGISAAASAEGKVALAVALIEGGIQQHALGQDAGTASILNGGTLALNASATAAGSELAVASAINAHGIYQSASAWRPGGSAAASLENSGSIALAATASAEATDGPASALAVTGKGIVQVAAAQSQAAASLNNDGDYSVIAEANAVADQTAFALGLVSQAIAQTAIHTGLTGAATTSFVNDGTIAVDVDAQAMGGTFATAIAFIGDVVHQSVFAGPDAVARADISNNGLSTISASAIALADFASATAVINNALFQSAAAVLGGSVEASIANDGEISIVAHASAENPTTATAGSAFAAVTMNGYFQAGYAAAFRTEIFTTPAGATVVSQINGGTGPGSLSLSNSGLFEMVGSAVAAGAETAFASANLWGGSQVAIGTSVDVDLVNTGTMSAVLQASAVADTIAFARALNNGFEQRVNATEIVHQEVHLPDGGFGFVDAQLPIGPASAAIVNEGAIEIVSFARAQALGGKETGTTFAPGTIAGASVYGSGLAQFVWGTQAAGSVVNSGTLVVDAQAQASGEDLASARAFAHGIRQGVTTLGASAAYFFTAGGSFSYTDFNLFYAGPANATLINSGSIAVVADASAIAGEGPALASADARGFAHAVAGTSASIFVDNQGELFVAANAFASGTTGRVDAVAAGMTQAFSVGTNFTIEIANSGLIDIEASAHAVQDNGATAIAAAIGLTERGAGVDASLAFANSGTLNVNAAAVAEGGYFAGGTAFATGVAQGIFSPFAELAFDNSGMIVVEAAMLAVADADTGFAGATAFAHGYIAIATNAAAHVANSGSIEILAKAAAEGANGWAWATAAGIAVAAVGGTFTQLYGVLSGTVTNAGTIDVVASAAGIADGIDTRASTAEAVGIVVVGGSLNATVENSGIIEVSAVVSSDQGNASAVGIQALGEPGSAGADDIFTVTNDGGTIIVRESVDGGATWTRGLAIDVAAAPHNSVINLLGDGFIYGDIDVRAGDEINVQAGETFFYGVINPEFVPPGGLSEAQLDSGLFGEGVLNIDSGGNLILADPRITGDPAMYDGPAYAFVDTLNVDAGGVLTFQLEPAEGGTQPVGTYPQIFADVANLDGALVADLAPANGLFADFYFWNNVIDANALNGQFATCAAGSPFSASPLLDLDCEYDDSNNVDLALERIAFNAIGGLTNNQAVVATALENVYSTDLTGDFADLVASLFLLDEADLVAAYEQLSGVEYPNLLHAVRNNTFVLNSFVSDQIACAIHIRGIDECRAPETRGRLWIKGTYNSAELDGNDNFIGYDADSWSAMLGGDYQFGNFKLGAFIGYRDIDVDYPDAVIGSGAEVDGLGVGLYGAYDVGSFYVRGIGSYSWLGGESERRIEIFDISTTARGEPDIDVWSFYAEAGGRFDLGGSWLTPFVALDYTSMHLDGFAETDGLGAGLEIHSQTESQTSGLIGVKWAGNWGGVIPEAKLAYRHDFNGDLGVDMRFVDAPAGSDFRKEEGYEEGSLIAGLSLAGSFGSNLMGRIGYQGRFNDEVEDHAIYGSLTLLFGAPPQRR